MLFHCSPFCGTASCYSCVILIDTYQSRPFIAAWDASYRTAPSPVLGAGRRLPPPEGCAPRRAMRPSSPVCPGPTNADRAIMEQTHYLQWKSVQTERAVHQHKGISKNVYYLLGTCILQPTIPWLWITNFIRNITLTTQLFIPAITMEKLIYFLLFSSQTWHILFF